MTRAIDAEASVIGGCLLVPDAYWQVADLLTADDFVHPPYRALWEVLTTLTREGVPIDPVTVGDRNPDLAAIAHETSMATPGAANVRAYAEIVQRDAITRRVRLGGQRIAQLGGDDVLGEAQRIIASCAPRMSTSVKPVRDYLKESIAIMATRCEATEVLTGVPTSLEWLDEMLSGWQRADLIIIGARPSVGKTALAIQASLAAAKAGHATLFLSLEMSGTQLSDRMLAHLSGIDSQRIRQPKTMDEADWPRIARAGEVLQGLPIRIDDTSALTLEGVSARVRQADASTRLGLVVIDYLTQMTPPRANRGDEAIQMITRGLKKLAKDLRVPVMLLSQLSRNGTGKPRLEHLREAGAIEQDADVVVFLDRPDDVLRHLLRLQVAKQRNGPTGETYFHFHGETGRFEPTNERPMEPAKSTRHTRGFRANDYQEVA